MSVFEQKLGGLAATIELALDGPVAALGTALRAGAGRTVVAVGSGGSVVAAEYLARCRSTLALGTTIVRTPMDFVLGDDVAADEVWLLSAGADNPDIAAAFRAAADVGTSTIRMLTTRLSGAVAVDVDRHASGSVLELPVSDPKDGFLATHSLVATVAALLAASELGAGQHAADAAIAGLAAACRLALSNAGPEVADFRPGDTVLLLHDPQVRSVATLIETSLWETGIAPVQKVDFRNFAHGRHVWAARHPDDMFVLALTAAETRSSWDAITAALPSGVRRGVRDLQDAGRSGVARGIVGGLAAIGALGRAAGIDPGRPGRGEFARPIYDDPSLLGIARALTPAVRHKRRAVLSHQAQVDEHPSLCDVGRERIDHLGRARFAAVALDYDGTIVATERRFEAPESEMMGELTRLADLGVRIGVATGRGGSAGEMLRTALPARLHSSILVGYYNGGHVRTLDVDIREDAPEQDPGIRSVDEWLTACELLVPGATWRRAPVQITVEHAQLRDPVHFVRALGECPPISAGVARVLSSHHSFDIVPAGTTKLSVVRALRRDPMDLVLCLGDSGSTLGNDHELLSEPHAASVDTVCGAATGCWTLFGEESRGPEAVLRILQALRPDEDGTVAIDLVALGLDT